MWGALTPFSRNNDFLINDFASCSLKPGFVKCVLGLVAAVRFPAYSGLGVLGYCLH